VDWHIRSSIYAALASRVYLYKLSYDINRERKRMTVWRVLRITALNALLTCYLSRLYTRDFSQYKNFIVIRRNEICIVYHGEL